MVPIPIYLNLFKGARKWGRYSLIGLQTSTVLRVYGQRLEIIRDGKPMVDRHTDDPMAEVERFRNYLVCPSCQICQDLPVV